MIVYLNGNSVNASGRRPEGPIKKGTCDDNKLIIEQLTSFEKLHCFHDSNQTSTNTCFPEDK